MADSLAPRLQGAGTALRICRAHPQPPPELTSPILGAPPEGESHSAGEANKTVSLGMPLPCWGHLVVGGGGSHMDGPDGEKNEVAEGSVELPLAYEPNPKHKPLPQPGRHGSQCPRDADGPALLQISDLVVKKRFATDGTNAYCAQQHSAERNLWHGYPVTWEEVPPKLRAKWVTEQRVSARTIRRAMKRRD